MVSFVVDGHIYYEYHYSPNKLAFQNTMQAGDQKVMIDLEWPYNTQICLNHPEDSKNLEVKERVSNFQNMIVQ